MGQGVMVHVMYVRCVNPAARTRPAQNKLDIHDLHVFICMFTFSRWFQYVPRLK